MPRDWSQVAATGHDAPGALYALAFGIVESGDQRERMSAATS